MAKPTVIFDVLANVLQKKSKKLYLQHVQNQELFKTYSSFMILRYLTMCQAEDVRNIVLDNYLQLERMFPEMQYKWLLKRIPKQNSSWIQYLK